MASFIFLLQFQVLILLTVSSNLAYSSSCYNSIFSFGDSLTDTGNYLISVGGDDLIGRDPYGMTYFHRPTGRYSNGRIILDFIAEAMDMPFLPPFLGGNVSNDFRRGANFAVGGAVALGESFYKETKLPPAPLVNYSLGVQMDWFRQLLPSLCSSDCEEFLSKSLFIAGEIGGNDYGHALELSASYDELLFFLPQVLNTITTAINELIDHGARTIIVPGVFPIGCLAEIMSKFSKSAKENDYDPDTGCIKWLSDFAVYHNDKLQDVLNQIRIRYPYVTIIYADYYYSALSFLRSPRSQGGLKACCGGGGAYNYNSSAKCGSPNARACDDPSTYFCWDGEHLTESVYKIIADKLLFGSSTVPSIADICTITERRSEI